jgi:hypothetical protein
MTQPQQHPESMSLASLFQTTPEKAEVIMARIRNSPKPKVKESYLKVDLQNNLAAEPVGRNSGSPQTITLY